MLLQLPGILSAAAATSFRERLAGAGWAAGAATAGHQSARAKHNLQVPECDPTARELGQEIAHALGAVQHFVSAALPQRIFPPLFSCYRPGDRFDTHVDNAIRYGPRGTLRADLSATLFLSPLDDYEGGTLVIEDQFGPREIRLPPGDMVLYPASSLHHVTPVTRGERLAAVFWIQSLIRDDGQRRILFDLDRAIQDLAADLSSDRRIIALTGVYHNLVRRWAEP